MLTDSHRITPLLTTFRQNLSILLIVCQKWVQIYILHGKLVKICIILTIWPLSLVFSLNDPPVTSKVMLLSNSKLLIPDLISNIKAKYSKFYKYYNLGATFLSYNVGFSIGECCCSRSETLEYKPYQNDWYWDITEFPDFFHHVMNPFRSKCLYIWIWYSFICYKNFSFCQ